MSIKYSQNILDHAKKSAIDAIKTAKSNSKLKYTIQKTAKATGDLIGNKMAHQLQKSQKVDHKIILKMKQKYQKKDIYPPKNTANYWWIKINIIM